MNIRSTISALLISFFLVYFYLLGNACSMYKVTLGPKTMVGCNEDAWRTTSRIWFENAINDHEYGAGFTGSRKVGRDRFAPQSGMNEVGLVSLNSSLPSKNESKTRGKKGIDNEVQYLTDILHKCRTIDDVKRYMSYMTIVPF